MHYFKSNDNIKLSQSLCLELLKKCIFDLYHEFTTLFNYKTLYNIGICAGLVYLNNVQLIFFLRLGK